MNDSEREMWVLNDESLYRWWQSTRKGISTFIRENREQLTRCINAVLGKG